MPLRGGTIRTAEEKLKQVPPSIQLETTSTNIAEARQSDWANQSILPAIEGQKPWLTTCKYLHMQRLPSCLCFFIWCIFC
jgi:DnaJ homolog subfamily C member 28